MLPLVSCCSLSSLGFHLMLVMAGLYSPQSIGFLDKNVSQICTSFMIVMIFNYFFWRSKILYPSLQATYTCASYWSNLGIFFSVVWWTAISYLKWDMKLDKWRFHSVRLHFTERNAIPIVFVLLLKWKRKSYNKQTVKQRKIVPLLSF